MTQPTRKRDWTAHDAAIPFRCPQLIKRNGTNRAGRRPHPIGAIQEAAANDNAPVEAGRVAPVPHDGS